MTAHINFVRTLYDACLSGRIDTIVNHCADDIRWECVGNAALVPHAGVFHGRSGVNCFFETIARAYAFDVFSPDRFHADNTHVFCFGHVKVRPTATNRLLDNRFVHAFTLRDGQVAEFTEFTDTAAIAVAAGTLR